jgi:hypothetical protein
MGFREKRDLLRLVVERIKLDNWKISVNTTIPLDQLQLNLVFERAG